MNSLFSKNKGGFSIIETVLAIAIFAGVSLAMFASFNQSMKIVDKARSRAIMANIAAEQLEIIRNLPFSSIGTISGIPSGLIPQSKTVTRGNSIFTVNTIIRNIDLPYDGVAPSDTAPADNKFAQVEIICTTCQGNLSASYSSQFGPKDLEGSSANGSLFIRTIDAAGQPVIGATVAVKATNPVIDLIDETGLSGILQLVGAVPAKNMYQVYVSKPGYTSDMTYSEGGPTTTKPVIPYATVDPGVVTQLTFVIDKVSTLNVSTLTPACTPVASVPFTLRGNKLIGTEPVYKYNKSLTTNGSGEYVINDFEWDTYLMTVAKVGYVLAGVIPSPSFSVAPGATQSVKAILVPDSSGGQNQNTIAVSVKDALTGLQLSGVNVSYQHSQQIIESITGLGQATQSDWSSGSGQDLFDDPTAYDNDDGNISGSQLGGSVQLRKSGATYANSGFLISSTFDTGVFSNYSEFHFSPTTKPIGTNVEFQLATSNSTSGPFEFVGPDGTASTTYTALNSVINSIHNNKRYIKYKMILSTSDTSVTPVVEDLQFTYTSECTAPGQTYAQSLHNGSWVIEVSKPGYNTIEDHVTTSGSNTWLSLSYTLDPL